MVGVKQYPEVADFESACQISAESEREREREREAENIHLLDILTPHTSSLLSSYIYIYICACSFTAKHYHTVCAFVASVPQSYCCQGLAQLMQQHDRCMMSLEVTGSVHPVQVLTCHMPSPKRFEAFGFCISSLGTAWTIDSSTGRLKKHQKQKRHAAMSKSSQASNHLPGSPSCNQSI